MTLGRLILELDAEPASLIRGRWLTKIFIVGDIISFLLQCGGGGYMAAGTLDAMEIGKHIVIISLAIQLLWFGFFILITSLFHWRALYAACVFILIHSVFQVIEFVQGNTGFIMSHEYLLYIFNVVLIALAGIMLVLIFPGSFILRCRHGRQNIPKDAIALGSQLS
ncbi:hypothetical protein CDV55_107581 [Aspergillus turcosus]|nr:hypothetical protein CDV55_107581 [Aspergillus turcosus]